MRQSVIYIEFLDIAGLPLQDTELVRFTRRALQFGLPPTQGGRGDGI